MPNMNDIFTSWGKAQRQIPPRNDTLKSEMLVRASKLGDFATKRPLPWFSFAFAGLAVLALILQPTNRTADYSTTNTKNAHLETTSLAGDDAIYPYYQPDNTAITDSREFMKIDYRAEIRARQVNELGKKIQTIVHGYDGRIDSLYTSEQYGSILFVLPADKLDAFQAEIKTLAPRKFVAETISVQNLLEEKRRLEQQKRPDQQFLQEVATVHGTISLRQIRTGEIITLYAGPYWLVIVLAIAAIVAFFISRQKQALVP